MDQLSVWTFSKVKQAMNKKVKTIHVHKIELQKLTLQDGLWQDCLPMVKSTRGGRCVRCKAIVGIALDPKGIHLTLAFDGYGTTGGQPNILGPR